MTTVLKILVLRFSSIGDIVLTTPVMRCLHQQVGAEVHFLTKQSFSGLIDPNPYVHRVWTFKQEPDEVLELLRGEQFDWIIDLHHNLRTWRLKWQLGRPSKPFQKLNVQKWLLVNLGINNMPPVHIVQRYLQTVAYLGVKYDGKGLDYYIPSDTPGIETLSKGRLKPFEYAAFAIGATHATKRLPEDKILEICHQATFPIALLGGKTEAETGARIAQMAGEMVINLCGALSIHESARILESAKSVLTHDTGMMHIASALSRPIVSIWGSTVPDFGMYPFYPDGLNLESRFEVTGLACRPCSKIGFDHCPKGHFNCMKQQNTEAIVRAL